MSNLNEPTGRTSKSILLKTATPDFLEFVGNGKKYAIPPYQRDYSWGEEHWDDLWNDILALRDESESRHYMGALVVQAKTDRDFLVIDGQQRLATLSIVALVVIDKLKNLAESNVDSEKNLERSKGLRNRYIGEKDPASLIESSKLTMNATDDGFYQDYLVQLRRPQNPRGLPKSNRLMWDCFQWFSKRIDGIPELKGSGDALAHLLNEVIARRLLFILITVDDDLNAYTVFETLNARGLELSATDLLKNYLFSRIRVQADLDVLQRRWLTLIGTVTQESFPDFLRYHLLCEQSQIRSSRLFKLVRDRVTSSEQVFQLMVALENRCELYAALSDPSHEYWIERPECKSLIRERLLLRSQVTMPMLFAAWEKFEAADFARILKLSNVLTFRYTTICNQNANELEPAYHRAAKQILDGKATTPRDVFLAVKSVYIEDKVFKQNFENFEVKTTGQGKKLARYILCRIESEMSGNDVDPETDSATIEHVLPENPSQNWINTIPALEWPKLTYRLGNLTLLEAKPNRTIGNDLFEDKNSAYRSSRYLMTQQIPQEGNDAWNATRVEKRQQWMATRATHLWRSDFDQ